MMTTPLPLAVVSSGSPFISSAAALARLAQTRDADAWAFLVERHGGEMFRVAVRITGEAALAEDVCQEALLQLRDFAAKFQPRGGDPEGAARAWILHVTCNAALKLRRTRQRAQKHQHEAAKMQNSAATPGLPAEERERLAQCVRAELEQLPDAFQQPLALRYYGGLDVRQVAEQLRLSEEATRKRISRGLEKLRQRLPHAVLAAAGAELGMLFALPESAESLTVSSHHLAQWKGLLTSPHHAALPAFATAGGVSLMAKCVMGITAVVVATVAGLQVRKAWTADERPGPPSAQITVIADPPIPPKTKITVSGDAEKYPYELPIELGDQDFAADDRITIQQIRGTKSDVAADGDYQICGTYTLASADSAELAVQSGNKISRQPVTKGTGPYVLTLIGGAAGFPRVAFLKGKLHIPFGIVWFGHGDTVFKAARLNQKVPFEIGNTNFGTGDSITVTSVESDRTTFEVGGLYRVSGTYTLGSQDGAAIAIFGTLPTVGPEATQAIDAMRFVPKGDGKFTLTFKLMGPCWPHVSYYPSAGGEGFGGTYFGTGNFLLKSEPGQRPAQSGNKKAEKDEF